MFLIASAFLLAPLLDIAEMALAWGVFIAGIVQWCFQIPFLVRASLFVWPTISFRDPGVKRLLKNMAPAIFGVSVAQINLLVDTIFASFLMTGSVSWLYFADRLMNFPLGVFGVAFATVILPHLSRAYSVDANQAYTQVINWALKGVLFICIPAAIGLYMAGDVILITLFHYGEFTAYDVARTYECLMAFALGIPAFMLVKVLGSAFYASQDYKAPVKIGIASMLLNIMLNLLLIQPLAHMGLALATTIAAYFQTITMWYVLKRKRISQTHYRWLPFSGLLLISNILLAIGLMVMVQNSEQWYQWTSTKRFGVLTMVMTVCMMIYIVSGRLCGLRKKDLKGPRLLFMSQMFEDQHENTK